jgi:hypothetical protein
MKLLAIDRSRRCKHVKYEPKGLHEFIVESRRSGILGHY